MGPHVIRGQLTDSHLSTEFTLSLNVINDPPFFEYPLKDQRVYLYNEFKYFLPTIIDEEGMQVKFSA
jgi:hypothetical protein